MKTKLGEIKKYPADLFTKGEFIVNTQDCDKSYTSYTCKICSDEIKDYQFPPLGACGYQELHLDRYHKSTDNLNYTSELIGNKLIFTCKKCEEKVEKDSIYVHDKFHEELEGLVL